VIFYLNREFPIIPLGILLDPMAATAFALTDARDPKHQYPDHKHRSKIKIEFP
jgi:hypothetical protein